MSAQTRLSRLTLNRSCRWKNSNGFTLLELLVVVAIIGILATIAIPAYRNYIDKAQRTVAISTLDAVRKSLEVFHIDNQGYPTKPIDFSTGEDAATPPRTVFSRMFLEQINADLTEVSYNTATNGYLVTAKAKDKVQTLMTLTLSEISY